MLSLRIYSANFNQVFGKTQNAQAKLERSVKGPFKRMVHEEQRLKRMMQQ
jgi:hypothetical protein